MSATVLASDFGGTNLRFALIDSTGKVLIRHEEPTLYSDSREILIEKITRQFEKILAISPEKPQAIGIAAAGLVNSEGGEILSSPHIPGFKNLPLGLIIKEQFGIPVIIENDASAAALGEYTFGASQGYQNILHATLGTGIGGGIIIEGELYKGQDGLAGEIGHLIFDPLGKICGCGARGCLETLVSGTSFGNQAQELILNGQAPILASIATDQKPTTEMLYAAALQKEQSAIETIQNGGHLIGLGLITIVNVLNPEVITLSGGLLKMGNLLIEPIRETMKSQDYGPAKKTPILESQLGENCGLLGAAAIAFSELDASHQV